ncbi:lantibiotic dehydratase [Streptomyces sp. M10(2022)]
MVDGSREIVLTDDVIDVIDAVAGNGPAAGPPHVEMCARIHAEDIAALDRGDFTLTVTPARSAGTLTSRFTPAAGGSGLEEVYRTIPGCRRRPARSTVVPAAVPHTENVCRIPAYLPHLISLGEHRGSEENVTTIPLDDLALTATHNRLHLVSISRRRIIEPQVFHAMALEKQPPPLARFLAHVPRAFTASWTGFDWGLTLSSSPTCQGSAIGVRSCPRRGGVSRVPICPPRGRRPSPCGGSAGTARDSGSAGRRPHAAPDSERASARGDPARPSRPSRRGDPDRSRPHRRLRLDRRPCPRGRRTSCRYPPTGPFGPVRPAAYAAQQLAGPHARLARYPMAAREDPHPPRADERDHHSASPRLLEALPGEAEWWFLRYRSPHESRTCGCASVCRAQTGTQRSPQQ